MKIYSRSSHLGKILKCMEIIETTGDRKAECPLFL